MADDPNEDRIAGLEARIAELQTQLGETRKQLTDAQLDQWKGRIDELEVQMHLGRLDAEEQMEPVVEQLRNWWLDAREQVTTAGTAATSAAGDVFDSLRSGVEQAMEQLRKGARTARGGDS